MNLKAKIRMKAKIHWKTDSEEGKNVRDLMKIVVSYTCLHISLSTPRAKFLVLSCQ